MFRSFVEGFRQGYNTNNSVPKSTPTKPAVAAKPKPKCNAKDEAPKVESKRKFKKRYIVLGFFALPAVTAGVMQGMETPEQTAARIALEQKQQAERVITSCQSKLERELGYETKLRLRDPDSFEERSTMWLPLKTKDGYIAIMTYGARNGFGGMTVEHVEAEAIINAEECSLKSIRY